ncbi:hypothetical protein GCM10011575_17930 [Microlunatus endophyticus]|uniref:Cobalt transporter subunit (CbtA) n=1 Tax=Microlunatus endophyticus TaxID=1716077 RepID=A0A917S7J2_9ACTN|nr:CbtA family protein [Microlunatus endophyticus]GGL59794.1 hypothetical protein GCM10011575_17930 [Microlunatus endophyticus]
MEFRVILRGALSGLIAGVLGFAFARIFAEPIVQQAIDYESGRDAILDKLNKAAGLPGVADGPEIFSRSIQSTVGIATGIIAFSVGMGLLLSVAYLVLHGRFGIRPRTVALLLAGFGFFGMYLLPSLKYPANPPAIGHDFTIATRGALYLTMVGGSLIMLAAAAYLGYRLRGRFGVFGASLLAAAAFVAGYSILAGVLPSLGNLAANVAHQHDFGYARAATETPQPITDQSGAIVYPGFSADLLWRFRLYSIINQMIIWTASGLIFSVLLERVLGTHRAPAKAQAAQPGPARQPIGA